MGGVSATALVRYAGDALLQHHETSLLKRHDRCFDVESKIWAGVEYMVLDAFDVPAQSVDAVSVDTAEVGEDEGLCYELGAIRWDIVF